MSLWDRFRDFADDIGDRIRDLFSGGEEPPEEPPEPPAAPAEPEDDSWRFQPEDIEPDEPEPEDMPEGYGDPAYLPPDYERFMDNPRDILIYPRDTTEYPHGSTRKAHATLMEAIKYAVDIPIPTNIFRDQDGFFRVHVYVDSDNDTL